MRAHRQAVLCLLPAASLRRQVTPILASRLDAMVRHGRRSLKEELHRQRPEPGMDRCGCGATWRAAEFPVSQRGLRA